MADNKKPRFSFNITPKKVESVAQPQVKLACKFPQDEPAAFSTPSGIESTLSCPPEDNVARIVQDAQEKGIDPNLAFMKEMFKQFALSSSQPQPQDHFRDITKRQS